MNATGDPAADRGAGLARESRVGIAVTVVLAAVLMGAADLTDVLGTADVPWWIQGTVCSLLASGVGSLAARLTSNVRAHPPD